MTLKSFLADGRVKNHKTSPKEIRDLLNVVDRDLADCRISLLSADRRFATAYNACLQLATLAIYAAGYRASGAGHHWVTFQVLPEVMGKSAQGRAGYFDGCRLKRNATDYDRAGEISDGVAGSVLNIH